MQERKKQVQVAVAEPKVDTELLLLDLATTIKSTLEATWKIGKLTHELHERGYSDQAITDELTKREIAIERSTINLYRLNYEYYRVRYGFTDEELAGHSIHALAAMRRILSQYALDRDTVLTILKRALGKDAKDAELIAAKAVGKDAEDLSSFVSLRVPVPVKDMAENLRERLQGIADRSGVEGQISLTNVVEFSLVVIDAMSDQTILTLWKQAHGEE